MDEPTIEEVREVAGGHAGYVPGRVEAIASALLRRLEAEAAAPSVSVAEAREKLYAAYRRAAADVSEASVAQVGTNWLAFTLAESRYSAAVRAESGEAETVSLIEDALVHLTATATNHLLNKRLEGRLVTRLRAWISARGAR